MDESQEIEMEDLWRGGLVEAIRNSSAQVPYDNPSWL